MDRADVVERLYGAVEALVLSSPAGLRCEYEYLPTDRSELPCVSMQVLDGDPIERRYLDGGTVWRLPVALVLRQAADDTAERLDAQEILRSLCAAVRSLADPSAGYSLDLGSGARLREIEAGTLPARVQARRNHRLPGDAGGQIQDAAIGRRLVHGERRRRVGLRARELHQHRHA
ncbi:MAG: hypothetical protein ACLSVD_02835 [Eggerthellaceae bacterium]